MLSPHRPRIIAIGGAERIHAGFHLWGWLFDTYSVMTGAPGGIDRAEVQPETTFYGYPAWELYEIACSRSEFQDADGRMIVLSQ